MTAGLEQRIEITELFYEKDDVIYPHSGLWGDFNFCLNGILEYEAAGQIHWSPPSYGLWLPPHTAHHSVALDEHTTHYVAVRLDPALCRGFSAQVEVLSIAPFFRQLIQETLRLRQQGRLTHYRHALQMVLDQLQAAPKHDHYLPQSRHAVLQPILADLAAPALFTKSLQQILARYALSERQLLRLSQAELQLSLSEWRSRAKILHAAAQLRQGISIKALAAELGYQHSSNFIEFFKRYTGQTPAQLKAGAALKRPQSAAPSCRK